MIRVFTMKAVGKDFLAVSWSPYLTEERKKLADRKKGERERQLFLGAEVLLNSMVLEVIPEESAVICVNSEYGMTKVKAGSIVLAMGCRERTRAGIMIPGQFFVHGKSSYSRSRFSCKSPCIKCWAMARFNSLWG